MMQYFFNPLVLLFVATCFYGNTSSPVIAAYYENYSSYQPATENRPVFALNMIDTDIITDLYFAFAGFGYISKYVNPSNPHLTEDFSIQPIQENDQKTLYPEILKLKQNSKKGLRIFLSIGGWNFNNPNDPQGVGQYTHRLFSQMVSTAPNRKLFIDSAIEYAHRYGFDGIDIDWEYPGDTTRGGTGDDFNNFFEFVKECSAAFKKANPPLYLSYSAPAHIPGGLPDNFQKEPPTYFRWIAKCAQYLDRINIMAYDFHTPFDDPKITGANSPLNRDTNPQSPYYIAKALDNYLTNNVPADKIILGIPTFGHSYAGVSELGPDSNGPGKPFRTAGAPGPSTNNAGLLAYFEIMEMIEKKQLLFSLDKVTNTAYGYHESSQNWVSFDNPNTIKLKVQSASDKKLKGVIFWSINMDEYQHKPTYPNIRSAREAFE